MNTKSSFKNNSPCSIGPLLFLLYINDLPQITNDNSETVLFADDTSIVITNHNPKKF